MTTYTFTVSGATTWACPGPGVAVVELWGAGGSGSDASAGLYGGSGGGSGGYCRIEVSVQAGNYPLTVGAAAYGTDGGESNFSIDLLGSSVVRAYGGKAATPPLNAGAGGSSLNGYVSLDGNAGTAGTSSSSGAGGAPAWGGVFGLGPGKGGDGGAMPSGLGQVATGGRVVVTYSPTPVKVSAHSPAEVVQQMLIDMGIGTDITQNGTWPVASTTEPDEQDNVITVYDTQGTDDGRIMVDGTADVHHGIQVKIRAYDHKTGYVKAKEVRANLLTVLNRLVSLENNLYLVECLTKVGDVLVLGQDAPNSKRRAFTLNMTVPITLKQ